jgi:lipopolysaccharide transport system permease protein
MEAGTGSTGRVREQPALADRGSAVPHKLLWTESKAATGWFRRIDFRELWSYRELAFFLALRDLKLRYRQTFFGAAWAVLQPLIGAAIFSVVFGRLAKLPTDGIAYPAFVYSGLVIWTYFSGSLERASQTLVENTELVSKVYFPRLLAPLAAVLPGLVDLLFSLVVLAIFIIAYGISLSAAVAVFPVWVMAAVAIACGAGFLLSALNVQYRDVKHALNFLLSAWFFATPIVYSGSVLKGAWGYVLALNPMVGVIDGFRWSVVAGPPPTARDFISIGVGVLLLVAGALYFQRQERRFADVI